MSAKAGRSIEGPLAAGSAAVGKPPVGRGRLCQTLEALDPIPTSGAWLRSRTVLRSRNREATPDALPPIAAALFLRTASAVDSRARFYAKKKK